MTAKKLPRLTSIILLFIFLAAVATNAAAFRAENKPATADNLKARRVPVKPSHISVSAEANTSKVIVKFKEGLVIQLSGNEFVSPANKSDLSPLRNALASSEKNLKKPLINRPNKSLKNLKVSLEASSGRKLADFSLYFTIDVSGPAEAERLVNDLNQLDMVEIAYPQPVPEEAGDIAPPTPDYEPNQYYLYSAPGGIDAAYANTLPGGDGSGVKLIDIEYAWTEDHEDLDKAVGAVITPEGGSYGQHGTAVIGEMIAGDNGYGVTGICPGADLGLISVTALSVPQAVFLALDYMQPGDLMLIELHAPGPRYNFQVREDQLGYVCMEYWQDVFDAYQYAWAAGMIVIEPAGNGAEDYDTHLYGQLFDTTYRNSHAIMVGGGAPPTGTSGIDRSRMSWSNYGERVNLQGQGAEVYTTGYGTLFDGGGDPNQEYTSTFAGTSSASPVVMGAATCLQGYYKSTYGVPAGADYIRDVLVSTGSPQQFNITQHIGPRPDLQAAIASLAPPPSLSVIPIYFDTAVVSESVNNLTAWIHNGSGSNALDFTLNIPDSLAKSSSWLSVSPMSGEIAASDSVDLGITIDASGFPEGFARHKGIIEISWGPAGGSLDSLAYLPVFFTVPCTEDTTYTATDNNDVGGPEYNWIDITTIGSIIARTQYYNSYDYSARLDDGTAGPYPLPFDFNYYGQTYNQIYIGVNGAISFTDAEVNVGGFYSGFALDEAPFQTIIPVFWNDLVIDAAELGTGHGDIYRYYSPTNDSVVILWYQMGNFNNALDTLTSFEVILTRDGDINAQYQSVGISGLASTASIGLSGGPCQFEDYVQSGMPPSHIVTDGSAVRFGNNTINPIMSGDVDYSGSLNLIDILFLIDAIYGDGPDPTPVAMGDVNCDGNLNLLDILYLIDTIYGEGDDPCFFIP